MPKAPDWLLEMTNKADGLVEDSPQFRQAEQQTQKANLVSASKDALGMVQDKVHQAGVQAAASGLQALKSGQEHIASMTPTPTPTAPTPFFGDQATSNVPPPNEFAVQPDVLEPPDLSGAPPTDPMQEDPMSVVQTLSEATGLDPRVVAMMSLLGEDISRNEQEGTAVPSGSAPPPPQTPAGPITPDFSMAAPPAAPNPVPQPPTGLENPPPSPLLGGLG